MTQHVAIFGGSFNPPHADHYRVLKWLATQCPVDLNQILVAVVGDSHAFGKDLAPYAQREKMVKAMVDLVSTPSKSIIIAKQEETYTVDFIHRLMDENPDTRYHLVVGRDVIDDIHEGRWKKWAEVIKIADLIPIVRAGEILPSGTGMKGHEVGSRGFSSTQIREQLAQGDLTHLLGNIDYAMLPVDVFRIIEAEGLYGYKKPEYPPRKVYLSDITIPFEELEPWIQEGRTFRLTGCVRRVLRVSYTSTEEGKSAVKFHLVWDTKKEKETDSEIRIWHKLQTDAWGKGEEFDIPQPVPTSDPIAILKPGVEVAGLSSAYRYIGHVNEYEFFVNDEASSPGDRGLFKSLLGF